MGKTDGRSNRVWRRIRLQVLLEEPRCYRCGRRATTVDHIIPLSQAPHLAHVRSNLRSACLSCNSRGGAKLTNAKRKARGDLPPWQKRPVKRRAPAPPKPSAPRNLLGNVTKLEW